MFRANLFREMGWPCNSLAEDLEMSLHLLLKGYRIGYQPHAIVTSEIAETRNQARSQRERWEWGRAQLWVPQGKKLFDAMTSQPRWLWLEAALDLLVPPLSSLVLLTSGIACLNIFLLKSPLLSAILILIGVSVLFYITVAMLQSKVSLRTWLALFTLPLYLLFKFTLYFGMLFKRETEWKRTSRETT